MPSIFEVAAAHCDVLERLELVKPEWKVRGVWFAMLRDQVKSRGVELLGAYDAQVDSHRAVTFWMYPVADYLRQLVVAGALIASPDKVHDGMRNVHLASVRYFATSLLGRAMVSLARPTPIKLLKQVERVRHLVANYGRQRVEVVSERRICVHITDEPVYIESAMLGSLTSVFDACGINAEVSVEMQSIFNGTLVAEW